MERPLIPTTEDNVMLKAIKGLTQSSHEQVNADVRAAVRAVLIERVANEYIAALDKWQREHA